MGFDTELVVRELREAHIWKLTEDLVYDWNGRRLTVPADTKTDFASVPKPCSVDCPEARTLQQGRGSP